MKELNVKEKKAQKKLKINTLEKGFQYKNKKGEITSPRKLVLL
ncbi:MAG: hypothetical protein ACWA42_07275 [Lutibacter sp.]